jgi:lysophospholipase L1-like esterase
MRKHFASLPLLLIIATLILGFEPGAVAQESRSIENVQAISPFIQSLVDIKTGRRTQRSLVVWYGDSHVKADLETGAARQRFQKDFGRSADGSLGVDLYILGVDGMRASKLLSWSKQLFKQNVSNYSPDLIVLAYGTNEVTDRGFSLKAYKGLFANIIRRFREASPRSSILVIGPPDRLVIERGVWVSAPNMPALLEAQRQAAFEEGAAFWSSSAAMGGAGSIGLWFKRGLAQKDMVHLTAKGYVLLADLFYRDIISSYNESVTARKDQPKEPRDSPSRIVGRSIRFRKPESDSGNSPRQRD